MANTSTKSTEPIPLRTLTVLLNYERMISDPRFKDVKLVISSLADPSIVNSGKFERVGRPPETVEWAFPSSLRIK